MRTSTFAVVTVATVFLWFLATGQARAEAQSPVSAHPTIRALRQLLDTPEHKVDFAKAKVAIDQLVDPTVDARATLAQIEAMTGHVRAMLPPKASTQQREEALRTYLYEPGPWNQGLTFGYDFDDPRGARISGKLLANYIRTRKGNCVSMPFLYIAIAQKLGLRVRAAMTPGHMFVKLRDDMGVWHNIETTSGGRRRRDVLYQQENPMTPEALANGIYMRPLGTRETLAVMGHVVAAHYAEKKHPEMVEAIADLLFERNPKDVTTLIYKGSAYATMLEQRFASKYSRWSEIPPGEREEYQRLRASADHWFDKADALGWRPRTRETEERYQAAVRKAAAEAAAARH